MTAYRGLTTSEINSLISNANRAQNWNTVLVSSQFKTDNISGCSFVGEVRLGVLEGTVESISGIVRQSALRGVEFINCTIADNVYIAHVGSYIANYNIEQGVYIEDIGVIENVGESSFGNGVMVATVNEAGGREVPLYDGMSAQVAYITAMYRHRDGVVKQIYDMVGRYAQSVKSHRGRIGRDAKVVRCRAISNVNICEHAVLEGVSTLKNGTINSNSVSITYVGADVRAYDFIFAAGAWVGNSAIIQRCFVGQACKIDSGYTAADSLIFSNSDFANGEACSIFAGPFTVSHHKSSLMIAGIFSFFNAGSGANQSNHLFKMGAVHQGVHGRGCKFSSDAYVMLPAREGAFTVILGRHLGHHNTEAFPFSYLMEADGKSYLMPAANLRSYGTVRDMRKWAQRDKRKGKLVDRINIASFNPYLGDKIYKAVKISEDMLSKDGVELYVYERARIKQIMLKRGLGTYKIALGATIATILSNSTPMGEYGRGSWVDLSGMYAPRSVIEALLDDIEAGAFSDIDAIESRLNKIYDSYQSYSRSWAIGILAQMLGHEPSEQDIISAIESGKRDEAMLNKMTEEDALRDCDMMMSTGYGIDADGDKSIIDADFATVRKL